MQSQTKEDMFIVLEKNHQVSLHKNMKAVPDKSQFFLTRVKILGHIIERNSIKISHRCNPKNLTTFEEKEKYQKLLEC